MIEVTQVLHDLGGANDAMLSNDALINAFKRALSHGVTVVL
jgi:hypothetical protein